MDIGKLDERIELQVQTETNNFGEVVKAYVTQATVWAKIISQKGAESFEAARMGSSRAIKVQLRFRDDVKTDWRIIWDGEPYNIVDVDRTMRRDGELWLMCETSEAE